VPNRCCPTGAIHIVTWAKPSRSWRRLKRGSCAVVRGISALGLVDVPLEALGSRFQYRDQRTLGADSPESELAPTSCLEILPRFESQSSAARAGHLDVTSGWRKGTGREEPKSFSRIRQTESKPRRGAAEGIREDAISQTHLSPHRTGCCVDERGRPLLQTGGLRVWILSEDPGSPERLTAGLPDALRGLGLDHCHQLGTTDPVELGRQCPPAGQLNELERLPGGESFPARWALAPRHSIFTRPVEPGAANGAPRQQRIGRARARPVAWPAYEVLLAAVAEDVEQPLDLGRLLVRHENGLVPPPPELLSPPDLSTDLPRQVRVQVVHEGGEPIRSRNREQQMEVVGEKAEGVDLDGIEPRRASERPADKI
jgi:hypothetical protein